MLFFLLLYVQIYEMLHKKQSFFLFFLNLIIKKKKVLNRPCISPGEPFNFYIVLMYVYIPHRYSQDSLEHSNHPRWVCTFTLRLCSIHHRDGWNQTQRSVLPSEHLHPTPKVTWWVSLGSQSVYCKIVQYSYNLWITTRLIKAPYPLNP